MQKTSGNCSIAGRPRITFADTLRGSAGRGLQFFTGIASFCMCRPVSVWWRWSGTAFLCRLGQDRVSVRSLSVGKKWLRRRIACWGSLRLASKTSPTAPFVAVVTLLVPWRAG